MPIVYISFLLVIPYIIYRLVNCDTVWKAGIQNVLKEVDFRFHGNDAFLLICEFINRLYLKVRIKGRASRHNFSSCSSYCCFLATGARFFLEIDGP